jgi:Pyruvate/2-oxoacid:ferredoxin oxidoreductase gamma subunit
MVVLGAYVACSQVVSMDVTEKIVVQEFAKKPKFIDVNLLALKSGAEAALAEMEKTA